MPPRKSAKKSSGSRSKGTADSPLTLVYIVSTVLTMSFAWVIWPYIADALPASDQEKAVQRMEKEHPDAEVFTLPGHDLKKNP